VFRYVGVGIGIVCSMGGAGRLRIVSYPGPPLCYYIYTYSTHILGRLVVRIHIYTYTHLK
jgi:hypothetical protein